MNVLQVVPELNAGGVEATTLEITQILVEHGHGSHVISAGGRMEEDLLALGGVLHKTNIGSKNVFTVMRRIRLLRAIIHEHQIDIVHARSRAPAWPAYFAAKSEKVPFLTTYHGIYNGASSLKRYYNSIMTKGAHIIANSAYTKAHIIKTHGTQADKITVVPRGVKMERFDPATISKKDIKAQRKHWNIDPKDMLILLPGRLTRWKGQLVAIEALFYLPDTYKLVLLGDAQGREAYVNELTSKSASLGVSDRVIMPGHTKEVPVALMAADIVLSASTDPEAFGRVAAEAQAMGKAVVATAHGGSLETVLDGKTGILVPPHDAKAMARAITDIIENKDFDAIAARKRITAQFSTRNLQRKTLAVYNDLLN